MSPCGVDSRKGSQTAAVLTDEAGATGKHIRALGDGSCRPRVVDVNTFKIGTILEHTTHVCDVVRVKRTEV